MAQICPPIKFRATDDNGEPLAGGKLYTYQAGTSTPLETYTDQSGATPNTNPVILDGNGEADVWLGSNLYKFVLKTAADVTLETVDNVSPIGASSVATIHLANLSVTTGKLDDLSVTTGKLASLAVTTGKIADEAVTGPKIADAAIAGAHLQPSVVTTTKIADATITTAKIADNQITKAKLAAFGEQLSSSSGLFSTSSASYVDVTNLSVSITTTGRMVRVVLVPDGTGNTASVSNGTDGPGAFVQALRGATVIGITGCGFYPVPPGAFEFFDKPAAGTYTYKIQAVRDFLLGGAANVYYCKLLVYEL